MMKIKQIWEDLENDKSITKGLLIRRYSGTVLPDIFIAVQQPEKLLCIAASLSVHSEINISSFTNLQEIQVDIVPDSNGDGKNMLIFKLLNNQHKDIFAILCDDLILSIANETNENKLINILLNRFEKWKSLFNKLSQPGLSPEDQRGLFGELFFLRKFLQSSSDYQNILNTWVGPSKEIRDFQHGNWALEVKTTIGNNHQKVQISSERQLDTSHLEYLFLYYISLEKAQDSGETLPEIISSVKDILLFDTISLNRYKAKLYEAGYFDHHEELYNNSGYHIRQDNYYLVEGDFPRLQENELRNGVGDVKYSIIVSLCQHYIQTEINVFEKLTVI